MKDKLQSGSFKVNKDGVQGGVATHEPLVTKIVGTKIKGNNNELTASNGGQIEQTDIEGNKNQLKS
ncbi:hypothetical protein [Candidatus Electronema sp. PJ]|uniref:hypothetical protein n=1 Tax=Candidatus Electronema sp. PJ TaxID=3401572 RepID=UPI003AA88F22